MGEYDFAVNVVMVIKVLLFIRHFISHDLVNKLLIAKISLVERTSL